MISVCAIHFNIETLLRLDILVWLVGGVLLVGALVALYYQRKTHRRLEDELAQLAKIHRHTIEYDLVLKAMKLSVWRIDVPTRTITYESDYRESMDNPIQRPNADIQAFCNTLLPASLERIHTGVDDLMAGRIDEFHEQYEMRSPQGKGIHWGELFATIDKRDLKGQPLTIVGTSMNIDRQKEIEQALIEARNQAEESDRLKSAFLANISHEIRTPLNAIVGFSGVLASSDDMDDRRQLSALIQQNNTHLLRLFDDMVNMSKLEAGGQAIKREHFYLHPLLRELVDRFADEAARKGLKLEVAEQASDPYPFTDAGRLREILNQYMDNALKFTDAGGVTVGYDVRGQKLRLWVRDTGRGIAAEHCNDQLFERFFKVDDFVQGNGLGLSICRSLAKSLGGSVGVESKEGEGSLFWVEIDME